MIELIYPPNRLEALLASAAGEESWEPDYATLEAPRIELYLRKILGEDVELPERPITRVEAFLAYKCGEDVELPTPMTRIEMFLAKDTSVEPAEMPEPQTRIEYYLLNLQAGGGVELTVTGNAPVTLANAIAHAIVSLTQEGKVTQASTPTPSAPKDIVCNNGTIKYGALGQNLLNQSAANTVLGYYINRTDGEIKDSPYNFMFAGYMPVEAGKTYVAYGRAKNGNDLSDYNRVAWYDSTKTWIEGANYTQNQIAVVTAPNNAAYARFSCNPSGGTSDAVTQAIVDSYNWMFAEGTAEITPFVPFVGGIYVDGTPEVLSIGTQTASVADLFAVGDYVVDTQEIIGGTVTHKVGIKVLDGTEDYGSSSNMVSRHQVYLKNTGVMNNGRAISTHYDATTGSNPANGKMSVYGTNIFFCDTTNITGSSTSEVQNAFKEFAAAQYAAGTPIIVMFALATETTETVAGQHLTTAAGTNTVSVTSNVDPVTLTVVYKGTEEGD